LSVVGFWVLFLFGGGMIDLVVVSFSTSTALGGFSFCAALDWVVVD